MVELNSIFFEQVLIVSEVQPTNRFLRWGGDVGDDGALGTGCRRWQSKRHHFVQRLWGLGSYTSPHGVLRYSPGWIMNSRFGTVFRAVMWCKVLENRLHNLFAPTFSCQSTKNFQKPFLGMIGDNGVTSTLCFSLETPPINSRPARWFEAL